MVTEQKMIEFMKEEAYHPMTIQELEEVFQVNQPTILRSWSSF